MANPHEKISSSTDKVPDMRQMTANRPSKLLLMIFALIVFLLLFLSFISFRQIRKQQTTSGWVHNSFIRILKIEEHVGLLRDIEAQQRAFILTKDTVFLIENDSLKILLQKTAAELDSLFSGNTRQQKITEEIRELVQNRYKNMQDVIGLSKTHDIEELSPLLMHGYSLMDSLRSKVTILENLEDEALNELIEKKDEGDTKVLIWILLFSLTSLVALLLSFLTLRKEIYKRTKAETDSEILDNMVEERTSEMLSINRQLKEKNIELERKNSEINTFSFITSHDMQEPLRKIETFIKYIKENESAGISREVKQYFERILISAKRMRELINSLLIYSKYTKTQKFIQVDLNQVASKIKEKEKKTIIAKSAVVDVFNLPVISADQEQMEALFFHLIDNSLKFTKEGRTPVIKITAKKLSSVNNNDNIWRIDFSDNGIGFNEKYIDRIYTLFQQFHDRDLYPGTGIGLPICKKVVENHNGTISAKSKPGEGTTISVFLPERQSGTTNGRT